jgi:hypothetical protein
MVKLFGRKKSSKKDGDDASITTTPSGPRTEQTEIMGKRKTPKRPSDQNIATTTLRVKIPANVKPGDTFAVYGKSVY